eukprot:2569627-Prymnesium_polylepis.1
MSESALYASSACAVDAVSQVPAERWDIGSAHDAVALSRMRYGGFVIGAEMFDPAYFSISRSESAAMDPQQRLLLSNVCNALNTSGLRRNEMHGSDTGVFVGITHTEFARVLDSLGGSSYQVTGSALSIAAGRASYVLGLHGPCAAIETACSATIVSTHFARHTLQKGESQLAVAAGVSLMLLAATSLGTAVAGMTSARGRSHTFDARAD